MEIVSVMDLHSLEPFVSSSSVGPQTSQFFLPVVERLCRCRAPSCRRGLPERFPLRCRLSQMALMGFPVESGVVVLTTVLLCFGEKVYFSGCTFCNTESH